MAKNTMVLGGVLILMGIIGYLISGMASITALIPAFFGIPLTILGIIARNEKLRKHAMHGALLIALIGLAGTVMGVPKFFMLLMGNEVLRPAAVIVQTIMAILCLIYIVLGIKSFIDARKAQN